MNSLYEKRQGIIDAANDTDNIVMNISGKKYAARLAGARLDFPFAYCIDELGRSIDTEISWALAERIAKKETNVIYY